MRCPKCGSDTQDGAGYCFACGFVMLPAPIAGAVLAPPLDESGALIAPVALPGSDNFTRATSVDSLSARLTAGILVPGQTVGNRYHVIRLIGAGGMGSVYQAWDAELGIAVALKMIHPSVSADPAAAATVERRIKRELLLARQVTHKHVVRIHDLGDIEGIKYITMPYVQGADLATIIRQQGRLSVARALRYVRQIASGLAAAHDVGIVHRDLKPANIMIDADDHALIMDFGIARSDSTTGSGATGILGTFAYNAPEQAHAPTVS